MSTFKFKKDNSFEERLMESERIMTKYPERIPIICERFVKSKISDIDKNKFLVPKELTVAQFIHVIRKRLKITPETAIYAMINNMFPSSSTSISNLYDIYKDQDGFLYINYSGENIFG